jgi:hypothetical protein
MTLTQRVSNPLRGAQEFTINSGMERDGIQQRICLHPDRTLTAIGAGVLREWIVECDYCPQYVTIAEGAGVPDLAAWYWRVS